MTSASTNSRPPIVRPDLIVPLFIVLFNAIAYREVTTFDFINFDDYSYVVNNPMVNGGFTREGVAWAFGFSKVAYWLPVTWISHMLDCELFGLNPGWHHTVNLFIHIVNCIVLFFLFRTLTGRWGLSAGVALLFTVHPANVETVAWIAERKNLLSTLFWLLSIRAYAAFCRGKLRLDYALTILFYVLGLMSKPMVVTLPFVLILLDFYPLKRLTIQQPGFGRRFGVLIVEKLPLFALSAVVVWITLYALDYQEALISTDARPLAARILQVPVTYTLYLVKVLLPGHFAVLYIYPEATAGWKIAASVSLIIVVSTICIWKARQQPVLLTGWLWFTGTLVPVCGIVQAGEWALYTDRFLYVPAIGIFWIVAVLGDRLRSRLEFPGWVVLIFVGALAVAISAKTAVEAQFWRSPVSLFTRAIEISGEGSFKLHANLANALAREGRLEEALHHYDKAMAIQPGYKSYILNNIGAAHMVKGDYHAAMGYFLAALKENSGNEDAKRNLAQSRARLHELEKDSADLGVDNPVPLPVIVHP